MMTPVWLEYQSRLDEIRRALEFTASRQTVAALLAAAALAACLVLAWIALARRTVPVWLPLSVAAVAAGERARRASARAQLDRLSRFYLSGLARLRGEWQGEGHTGLEYEPAGHVYARDLGLFGPGSLFERLAISRTEVGRSKLAALLLSPVPDAAESRARQEAVRELAGEGGTAAREEVAVFGAAHEDTHAETFREWLALTPPPAPRWLRLLACALSLAMALSLLAAACLPGSLPLALPAILGIGAAEGAIALAVRRRVTAALAASRTLSVELGLAAQGIAWLERDPHRFVSPRLRELAGRVQGASGELHTLMRSLRVLEERQKDWFYSFSLLLMVGTQTTLAIDAWRAKHGAALAGWLDAWAEFEALDALGCYARENPDHTFAEIEPADAPPVFAAEDLAHPLLDRDAAVGNDIALDAGTATVVSGSNMAGKSTLLRAIGLAAVLSAVGAPVRARRLRLTPMPVCASIGVPDALGEAKSRFLAEVERLREAIRLARSRGRVLFLIDEMFAGTNSQDRRIAAGAVVGELCAAGGLGLISTHDLALASLPGAMNVHMGTRAGATGALDFDYRVKPGVTHESNGAAIVRMILDGEPA